MGIWLDVVAQAISDMEWVFQLNFQKKTVSLHNVHGAWKQQQEREHVTVVSA